MRENLQTAQGIISIAAIICLLVGWFTLFPPEINTFLSARLFYILVGISFILQSKTLPNSKFVFPMYIAAGFCVVGAFLPLESQFSRIKTLGLIAGVIISFASRTQYRQ